ncbi:MAG: hypothetical protein IPM66_10740 [Acidobacteriota bacterium]|nr:MAG: hypothetical protein IPM66_10740 [Acidobacteriota bacterium]
MKGTKTVRNARLAGLSQRLDGGSCLNQRSILLACQVFDGSKPVNSDLRLADLLEALWVLELIVISKNVSYDGTLPAKDLSELERATSSLIKGTQFRENIFKAISPRNPDEQQGFVRSAAMKADPRFGARGVLDSALETFNDYGKLFRQFWKKTRAIRPPEGGWTIMTGNRSLDTVSESIEQFLSDELGKLEKKALNPRCRNSSVLERYITPIVKVGAACWEMWPGRSPRSGRSSAPSQAARPDV